MKEPPLKRQLTWYFLLRVIFLTLILGITAVLEVRGHRLPTDKFHYPIIFIAGVYLFTIASAILAGRVRNLHLFAALQIIFDILLISCLVFFSGTSHSLFTVTYFLPIIVAGFMLLRRDALLMAAISTFTYGGMLFMEYSQYSFDILVTSPRPAASLERLLNLLAINGLSFFLVAAIATLLAGRLYRTEEALSEMEAKIRQSEKMAAVGEMAAGIAHEFRNPLAAISGSAQLLEQRLQNQPPQQQLLRIIIRECDRLESAVKNFLLFSRPARPKQEWLQLEELLDECVALLDNTPIWSREHRLQSKIPPELKVWADYDQLKQVFLNLLSNACQAMPAGGTVHCTASPVQLGGKSLLNIQLQDSGPGIPSEVRSKVFDPYFTTRQEGTGLGLAIVHQIISGHGGTIAIESSSSRGATFTIQLPVGPG